MSLRLRLLVGLAALVLGGLAVFGSATYLSLDHFLVGRLDDQLTTAATSLTRGPQLGPRDGPRSVTGQPGDNGFDPDFLHNVVGPDLAVVLVDRSGAIVQTSPSRTASGAAVPRLTRAERTGDLPRDEAQVGAARSVSGSGEERVAVVAVPGGGRVVVAGSLRPVTQTLHRLLMIEGLAGAVVILVTIGLGLALARMATRPLEQIADTADAIAGGDLGQRVAVRAPNSEAGRVGLAFNAMLGEIQQAFARRDATEGRLRRFVADASHELATPLTSIRGYAELFRRGLSDRPDDLATAMGRIEAESIRMGRLVDDLLLLAKLDSGRPVEPRPVDLSVIARDAADDLRVVAPSWPVTVDAAEPTVVLGDEDRLRQVVANLTSNAHRYTPAGTPITLRTSVVGATGVIEVSDEGPGLTAEQAAQVFDRFYRVDTARSRAEGGSGLGLAIVASLSRAMGGTATVDTASGHGTTFRIAIPLAPVET